GSQSYDSNNQYGIQFDKLFDAIVAKHPELNDEYELTRVIIRELNNMNLISNLHPNREMMTRKSNTPEITRIGRRFLQFLKSPINTTD
ncbi:MAG: hypothetical protein AAFR81_30005, partial [Chloroflexota bacterium]